MDLYSLSISIWGAIFNLNYIKLMLSRTILRFFSTTHKQLDKADIIAKMATIRTHVKDQEEENSLIKKQVFIILSSCKLNKKKMLRKIRKSISKESSWLKMFGKLNKFGKTPRRKVMLIDSLLSRTSLLISFDLDNTLPKRRSMKSSLIKWISNKDLIILWDSSLILWKSSRSLK